MTTALDQFHPLVAGWFRDNLGPPTDVQQQSWPKIAAGEHLLITAPTGSGKTLTAFLWAINQFIDGKLDTGQTRVLYISPLKALNNDIQRNLTRPLQDLAQIFADADIPFPDIKVSTRSGDTDAGDRRRMLRHPPEILITTPESLNLLLSSKGGRGLLHGIDTLILDEIHAVVGSKRGAYLASAVERLVPLSGEFQRIALSATIKPLDGVADFVGAYRLDTNRKDYLVDPQYQKRKVTVIESKQHKDYQVTVRYPEEAAERMKDEKIWDSLCEDFNAKIATNRSTLLFTNSRVLCEKLTYKINTAANATIAYAHHGSLSREIRDDVEEKLKSGDLAAIVATSSLEMGIDIGALDEVVLIQCPTSISSAIQRIGRAGHQVGEVSRSTIYPTHPQDFLEAAVLADAIVKREIEPVTATLCPLDVLSQIIISMVGVEKWEIDDLYVHLRASYTYHHLGRDQFDLVINMLAGRYAESRIRELKPKVSIDRLDNTIEARQGALLALYLSGGVIPDRGYFQLRHQESNSRIGELDEEFVWEARLGQVFTLGTQFWQITNITHNDVFVQPGRPTTSAPPFWKAEQLNRDFCFSERIAEFLEEVNSHLDDDSLPQQMAQRYKMELIAAQNLIDFLRRQHQHCGCALPHRHHLVMERIETAPGRAAGNQIVLHAPFGAKVLRPFAMALESAWRNRFEEQLEVFVTNDCLVLQLTHAITADELFSLVGAQQLEELIRQRLEGSGFFGARFRECAGRALLLSKGKFNERKPLWMSRLQSQKLMDSVLKYEDFPILLETWRTCLQDEFDLKSLKLVLDELASGAIVWTEVETVTPSPMAHNVAWNQINLYMYQDDQPQSDKMSNLNQDLLQQVVFTPGLRPGIEPTLIDEFQRKRLRMSPGYAPQSATDLLDWIVERIAIGLAEWEELLLRIAADDVDSEPVAWVMALHAKVVRLRVGNRELIIALENLPAVAHGFYGATLNEDELEILPLNTGMELPALDMQMNDLDDANPDELLTILLGNWLQFFGPITAQSIVEQLQVDPARVSAALQDLLDERALITGNLITDSDDSTYCDSGNFEMLLRLARQIAIPTFDALELEWLPLILHTYQSSHEQSKQELEQLLGSVEQLRCYPAHPNLWESEFLPARMPDYQPNQLDQLFQESNLHWVGRENKLISFCFADDLDLMPKDDTNAQESVATDLDTLLPDELSRYDFTALMSRTDWSAANISDLLWRSAWEGQVTNDTFMAVRRGIENDFQVPDANSLAAPATQRRTARRGGFSRWKGSIPFAGNWHRLVYPQPPMDSLETEELNKDRVRVLLDRYGILFRELLLREDPLFRWANLFRSLRLMEMSGEVLSGYFLKDIPGPQFASRQMFRLLQRKLPEEQIFWINATDPISLCGIQLPQFKGQLPSRLSSTHVVYQGKRIVMISRRSGKNLVFNIAADDPHLPDCLAVLKHLLYRPFQPVRQIRIETINDEPANRSEYLDPLRTAFDLVVDYKDATLHRTL